MPKDEAVNVLLVDDQPGKLLSYQVMLEDLGENLIPVNSAKAALAFLLKSEAAVVLIDVCMPELDGFELANMIRQHPRFQKTAIIFISAIHISETDFMRGYEAGAVDYLSVPVVPALLRAKVRVFSELFRKTRQLHQFNEELENRVKERTEALNVSNAQLKISEHERSLALAAGHMGSWGYELDRRMWFWDEGQTRIFGLEHRNFVPTMENVEKCIHPEDVGAFREAVGSLSGEKSSFELEMRIVRPSGEVRWCRLIGVATLIENDKLLRLSGVTIDITERKQVEDKQALLVQEVDHRAKNTLAVVQAIVRLARRDNIANYIAAVEGRINSLAKTHELLSRSRWEGADVLRLIQDEMSPYQEGVQRITAIGPPVMVSPSDAQALAIAVHELATNAVKYGALSHKDGRVDIRWSCFEETLALIWKESGGPAVSVPQTKGFGTKIIAASFSDPRRAKLELDWRPDGLFCTLKLNLGVTCKPIASLETKPQTEPEIKPSTPPDEARARRLLLVEDEPLVSAFMQDHLHDMGFEVAAACRTLEDGLAAAERSNFDAAILDINLNGVTVYPLADLLLAQGIPFVFVTGYSANAIDERFAAIPVLQKPVEERALARALDGYPRRMTA